MKAFKELERITKGFSNHRRIQILNLLKKEPELSIADIADRLDVDFRTISAHVRRLAVSGLLIKRSEGSSVRHKLTERGMSILMFLRTLE